MARVDKTDSTIGVVRADLHADLPQADWDKVIAVGLNGQGRIVKGAGQTGIVGVVVPDGKEAKAGRRFDIFALADIVDCAGLAAGTTYWANDTTGALVAGPASAAAPAGTTVKLGFTVEADRLIVRL